MAVDVRQELNKFRLLRYRQAVERRDAVRVVAVAATQMTQTEIAHTLGISQPAVSDMVKKAPRLAIPEGFSGAGPYEIAQRYAAGLIDRAQVIDELSRWEYAPTQPTDGVDWVTADDPEQTFAAVVRAADDGLLDDATYEAILDARDALDHTR